MVEAGVRRGQRLAVRALPADRQPRLRGAQALRRGSVAAGDERQELPAVFLVEAMEHYLPEPSALLRAGVVPVSVVCVVPVLV